MSSQKTVLKVDGKPFIAIAGEAHNSSSSNAKYMIKVWEKAKEFGLNTLLLPVSWELVEPVEGQFEFQLVDDIIAQAREFRMKIIFLWFGTWKNAQSMYAPEWVKMDLVRFPRAEIVKGSHKTRLEQFYGMDYTTLSAFGEETKKADAKAFKTFMKHLKEMDENEQTVIAVQVENETGLQGSDRDHSDIADILFEEKVPINFVRFMKSNTDTMEPGVKEAVEGGKTEGNWKEVFGAYAGEIFTAYYVANYIETVTAAGKEIYNLPMVVNCWLDKGEEAGKYPSGGPVAKMMEVWQYAAPSIDVIAPDIYVQNFAETCEKYMKRDNPLFIPETATHAHAAPRLVYCIGHYHATCFAPFGFEDMGKEFNDAAAFLFGVDTSDPLLAKPQNIGEYHFVAATLHSMMNLLTSKYGTRDLQAVISEKQDMTPLDISKGASALEAAKDPENDTMIFDDFGFKTVMNVPMITRQDGSCLIVKESEDTYYILANGCVLRMFSLCKEKPNYDIIALEEGQFVDDKWVAGRRLNGDEAATMRFNEYKLLKLKVFCYK